MARKYRQTKLPPPFLKRVWLDLANVEDPDAYPFGLPFLRGGFEFDFTQPITIIVGENGAGKSTLLEGIAVLAGYDDAGGGKGWTAVDHSQAREVMGGELSKALRAAWLPKVTQGWFFRAESFFDVARYLDAGSINGPDFLSYSHGEGFLRFFEERCQGRHGIFFFDEPESALSPSRQVTFLKLLHAMQLSGICQVIMATHSPLLMAYPAAQLVHLTYRGLRPIALEETEHFRMMRSFWSNPDAFVKDALAEAEKDGADNEGDDAATADPE
jgi:predicted ATPase